MSERTWRVLGIMSGSSLDGMDLALCEVRLDRSTTPTGVAHFALLAAETLPYSDLWQRRLANLPDQDARTFARTHTYFGHLTAEFALDFLQRHRTTADFIATHGHTVFHEPDRNHSAQIGDGAATAALTSVPTIAQFRQTDVAAGGQGAPIVPLFERLVLGAYAFFLNLGGIANLSYHAPDGRTVAFDVTGANQPLNALAGLAGQPYDADGALARSGTPVSELLERLDALPFLEQPYPKSLSNQWVVEHLTAPLLAYPASIADRLATAVEHTARQIGMAVRRVAERENVPDTDRTLYVTGGGAFNGYLLERLRTQLPPGMNLHIPPSDWVQFKEAMLMALLGAFRWEGVPNVLPSATGARRATVNGAVYLP